MKSELKKVQWRTKKQTINNTLIVIACVIVVGIFIALFDFVAGEAIKLLIGAFKGLREWRTTRTGRWSTPTQDMRTR